MLRVHVGWCNAWKGWVHTRCWNAYYIIECVYHVLMRHCIVTKLEIWFVGSCVQPTRASSEWVNFKAPLSKSLWTQHFHLRKLTGRYRTWSLQWWLQYRIDVYSSSKFRYWCLTTIQMGFWTWNCTGSGHNCGRLVTAIPSRPPGLAAEHWRFH